MKVTDIQAALSQRCGGAAATASAVATWIGHQIQVIASKSIATGKAAGQMTVYAAGKTAGIAKEGLAKMGAALSTAASMGAAGTKAVFSASCRALSAAASASLDATRFVAQKSLQGAQAAGRVSMSAVQKTADMAGRVFAASMKILGQALLAAKQGLAIGFTATKCFVMNNRKELLIASIALTAGFAIGKALCNSQQEPQTV